MKKVKTFYGWDSVPEATMKTQNQLSDIGLRPKNKKEPDAVVVYTFRKRTTRASLYKVSEAIEKRSCTEEQLAHLKTIRELARKARTCSSCDVYVSSKKELEEGYCDECYEQVLHRRASRDALYTFYTLGLYPQDWVSVDFETTGLDDDARIVEIAIVDGLGELLYHTFVNPEKPVGDSVNYHGYTDEFLADKPVFSQIHKELMAHLIGMPGMLVKIVAYNSSYERSVLSHELKRNSLSGAYPQELNWLCIANLTAQYIESYYWSRKHKTYQLSQVSLRQASDIFSLNLENWHHATADATATAKLIHSICSMEDWLIKEMQSRHFEEVASGKFQSLRKQTDGHA